MPFRGSDSPLLVMAPQPPPPPQFSAGIHRPAFNSGFPHGPPLHSWSNTPTTPAVDAAAVLTPTSAAAGRKRSRDEAAFDENEYFPSVSAGDRIAEEMRADGMDLVPLDEPVLPSHGFPDTPSEDVSPGESERPALRSSKSQRLHLGATPALADEMRLPTPGLGTSGGGSAPTIDDYTRYLGIGWSSVAANENLQAALRGWTKYIEKHFPLHEVHIRLQSTGLCSFLVEAREGYYLFAEDLQRCQMVSANLGQTFENLRGSRPVFEGVGVMEAGATPPGTASLDGSIIYDERYGLGTNGTDEAVFEEGPGKLVDEMDLS